MEKLLETFDKLTPPQRHDFMAQMETAAEANLEAARHLGERLRVVSKEKTTAYLPAAPKTK
jgi:hypothetical protein